MQRDALAPIRLGELLADEERPVAGLQREQLADRARVRSAARAPRRPSAAPPRARAHASAGDRRRAPGRQVARGAPGRHRQARPGLPPARDARARRRAARSAAPEPPPARRTAASQSGPSCHQSPSSSVSTANTQSPPPATRSLTRATKSAASPAGRRRCALGVVGRAVVAPGAMAVRGERVVVAVGRVGGVAVAAPDELDRRAVDRHEQRAGRRAQWTQMLVGPEHVRQVDADRMHAGCLEQDVEPRRVRALGQPQAALPALAEARAMRRRCRRAAAAGRRPWWRAAGAPRASPTTSTWRGGPSAPSRPPAVALERGEARARPVVARRRVLERGDDAGVAGGRRRCRGGATRRGCRRRNCRAALERAGRLELVAEHRRQRQRDRRAAVEHVEQRQVRRRDRLPQPLLAERPRAEALDVGLVGVQDDRELAVARRGARPSCAQDRDEVERAVAARAPCPRRSAKSRASIAGTNRS